jgi:hypothetical protein
MDWKPKPMPLQPVPSASNPPALRQLSQPETKNLYRTFVQCSWPRDALIAKRK